MRNKSTEEKGNGFRFAPHVKKNANVAKTVTTRAGGRMDDNFVVDVECEEDIFKFDSTNKMIQVGQIYGKVLNDLRIRKLTPKECWRLMGFDDEDLYKAEAVNSNAQLYKQAGNSIVVDVIVKIYEKLFERYGDVIK